MHDFLERQDPGETSDEDVPAAAAARTFVVEAVLQPYAEAAATGRRERADRPLTSGPLSPRCPVCSGQPCLGILREEGQGARRMMLCGRCLTEWDYLRVVCPATALDANGQQIVKDGHVVTNAEMFFEAWMKSKDRKSFAEFAYGKVKEEIELQTPDGLKVVIEYADSKSNPPPLASKTDTGEE